MTTGEAAPPATDAALDADADADADTLALGDWYRGEAREPERDAVADAHPQQHGYRHSVCCAHAQLDAYAVADRHPERHRHGLADPDCQQKSDPVRLAHGLQYAVVYALPDVLAHVHVHGQRDADAVAAGDALEHRQRVVDAGRHSEL